MRRRWRRSSRRLRTVRTSVTSAATMTTKTRAKSSENICKKSNMEKSNTLQAQNCK